MEYSEADFEECFSSFDKDGSGTIDKEEMTHFIKTFFDEEEEEVVTPVEILMLCCRK